MLFNKEDLPEPLTPVTATNLLRGIFTSIDFKLCPEQPVAFIKGPLDSKYAFFFFLDMLFAFYCLSCQSRGF